MGQPTPGNIGRIKEAGIGKKAHRGARAPPGRFLHRYQGPLGHAGLEALAPALPIAQHFDLQPASQSVHDRNPHAVKAAGKAVVFVGELPAGVKTGQDQLDPGDAVFRVHIHRHTPAVVAHGDGAPLLQHHLDAPGMARKRFVDAVVHHFLHQVVRPGRIRVHAGTFADRFKAREYLDRFGRIGCFRHDLPFELTGGSGGGGAPPKNEGHVTPVLGWAQAPRPQGRGAQRRSPAPSRAPGIRQGRR